MTKIENFIKAFRTGGISEIEICDCGEEYEEARKILLDGVEYVIECDCWRQKAKRIMMFLDENAISIAEYLNSERERKIENANQVKPIEV